MSVHAIEKELSKLTKVKPAANEDRQEFLTRLWQASNVLEDDVWDAMSKPTQDWTNLAVKAHKAGKELPDFATTAKPEKAAKAGRAAAKEKDADAGEPKRTRGSTEEGSMSCMMYIRTYLADNPTAAVDEIEQVLDKAKYKVPSRVTISTVRSEFRSLTKIFAEKGFFKQGVQLGKF